MEGESSLLVGREQDEGEGDLQRREDHQMQQEGETTAGRVLPMEATRRQDRARSACASLARSYRAVAISDCVLLLRERHHVNRTRSQRIDRLNRLSVATEEPHSTLRRPPARPSRSRPTSADLETREGPELDRVRFVKSRLAARLGSPSEPVLLLESPLQHASDVHVFVLFLKENVALLHFGLLHVPEHPHCRGRCIRDDERVETNSGVT